ncbi:MAG: hypothetical protein LQ338_001855 [Usnochroma carphineum]|nr:MAG: hypothetical protein LQ338_001855 [Usnochroma carphineum]
MDQRPLTVSHLANGLQDAFDLYHRVQEHHEAKSVLGGPALPALGHAIAGSTGAAISNVVTYPLALIVTRLQIQRALRKESPRVEEDYGSVQDAARKIYEQEKGIAGFYAGIAPDTAKTIADSFLFFLAYNFLRQTRLRARGGSIKHLPVTEELGVGFLAGAFSKFWTTPIANVVTRQQAASMLSRNLSQKDSKVTVQAIASRIQAEKGLLGFWSGYSASLVLTLNPSLTFFLFETLKRLFVPREKRSDPPAQLTFLLAAISKAFASATTYPFSLAKSRAQASSKSVNEKDTEAKGTAEKVEKETGSKVEKTRAKAPSNVFSSIVQIARTEGLGALYEGLSGEVLKGFFSHGFTMIVKQAVHKIIVRLYYATLKLLKRFPSPESTIGEAKEKADEVVTAAQQRLRPS